MGWSSKQSTAFYAGRSCRRGITSPQAVVGTQSLLCTREESLSAAFHEHGRSVQRYALRATLSCTILKHSVGASAPNGPADEKI